MTLGDIASVATLVLFVIYFIGRTITIVRNRSVFPDEIKMELFQFDRSGLDIVERFYLEQEPDNAIILTSEQGIYDLSIYKKEYDEKGMCIGKKRLKECKCDFVNKGQSVEFDLTVPEIFAMYEVQYYTPDYRKVTIELFCNLKDGVMSEIAKPKNTLVSKLYHLVK